MLSMQTRFCFFLFPLQPFLELVFPNFLLYVQLCSPFYLSLTLFGFFLLELFINNFVSFPKEKKFVFLKYCFFLCVKNREKPFEIERMDSIILNSGAVMLVHQPSELSEARKSKQTNNSTVRSNDVRLVQHLTGALLLLIIIN